MTIAVDLGRKATKQTNKIMHGRRPGLAIDTFLGIDPYTRSSTKSTEYVSKLRGRLDFAYKKALEQAIKNRSCL